MPPRKRTRKRKRRNVSSSSSSSSSDSDISSKAARSSIKVVERPTVHNDEDSDSDSSSSSSSSSATSSINMHAVTNNQDIEVAPGKVPHSRSPTPPSTTIPPLLPPKEAQSTADVEKEKELKNKFRQFWMASIADAFSDDLEEIRKEPNMTQSKLSLLIDSLASGADVFEKGDMESVVS